MPHFVTSSRVESDCLTYLKRILILKDESEQILRVSEELGRYKSVTTAL